MSGGDKNYMPKLDKTKLSQFEQFYVKKVEDLNLKRAADTRKVRGGNIKTALGLALLVGGIYTYSLFALKQENVLDEIDKEIDATYGSSKK